jgi:SAM-dependent methyltransferase
MPRETNVAPRAAKSSRDVLDFYDQYAADWDARLGSAPSVAAFHRTRLASFLRVARLRPTDRIAELGVGTGPYLDVIAPLVTEVICIDGSTRMLDVLQVKHGNLRNVRLLQLDLEQPLSAIDIKVDLVYAFGLIEHIIDVGTFLLNCQRLLCPGGRIVFVGANGQSPWYGWLRRPWRSGRHCSSDRYYTKDSLDLIVSGCGFVPEAVDYWGYFPAGAGKVLATMLRLAGKVIDKTPLRKYAGGLTRVYRLAPVGTSDQMVSTHEVPSGW